MYLVGGVNWIFVQKIWNCIWANVRHSETAWHAEPENIKTVYQRHSKCSKTEHPKWKILKQSLLKLRGDWLLYASLSSCYGLLLLNTHKKVQIKIPHYWVYLITLMSIVQASVMVLLLWWWPVRRPSRSTTLLRWPGVICILVWSSAIEMLGNLYVLATLTGCK